MRTQQPHPPLPLQRPVPIRPRKPARDQHALEPPVVPLADGRRAAAEGGQRHRARAQDALAAAGEGEGPLGEVAAAGVEFAV